MAAWKLLMAAAALAVAAGHPFPVEFAPPAYTAQQSNVLRTPGNLGQIATQHKSIHTPYSSVTKADVRASNDAVAYAPAPAAYAPAPAFGAAPGVVRTNLLGVAFSPSTAVAHITYANPNDRVNYAY